MTEMSRYAEGVPSWVDLATTDLEGAVRFYGGLFGWELQDLGEQSGHYTMATVEGVPVAALSNAMGGDQPHWTTYVDVDDATAVAKRVEGAGGAVVFGPTQVMSAGTMAVCSDPMGATFALWQPADHRGAGRVNEPATFTWAELQTSDLSRARAFYGEAFGWGWGGGDDYAEGQVDGRTVAGLTSRRPGVPDHWLVYFGSADVDADTARVSELGGSVQAPPVDIPGTGRFSVVSDPVGATFGLFAG